MKFFSVLLFILPFVISKNCPTKRINSKLICYYSQLTDLDSCYCSHVILPSDASVRDIEGAKQKLAGVKVLITVNEFNQVDYFYLYL